MEKETINISSRRRITIPKEIFEQLGFDTKAECFICGEELIIRPVKTKLDNEDAITNNKRGETK